MVCLAKMGQVEISYAKPLLVLETQQNLTNSFIKMSPGKTPETPPTHNL